MPVHSGVDTAYEVVLMQHQCDCRLANHPPEDVSRPLATKKRLDPVCLVLSGIWPYISFIYLNDVLHRFLTVERIRLTVFRCDLFLYFQIMWIVLCNDINNGSINKNDNKYLYNSLWSDHPSATYSGCYKDFVTCSFLAYCLTTSRQPPLLALHVHAGIGHKDYVYNLYILIFM